jgi:hypothetical protein
MVTQLIAKTVSHVSVMHTAQKNVIIDLEPADVNQTLLGINVTNVQLVHSASTLRKDVNHATVVRGQSPKTVTWSVGSVSANLVFKVGSAISVRKATGTMDLQAAQSASASLMEPLAVIHRTADVCADLDSLDQLAQNAWTDGSLLLELVAKSATTVCSCLLMMWMCWTETLQ